MSIRIKKATPSDISEIEFLYRQFVTDEYEVVSIDNEFLVDVDTRTQKVLRILNYFNNPDRTWFVALDGAKVIGTVLLTVKPHSFLAGKVGRVDLLFVAKEYRKKKIATALIKSALDFASRKGCNWSCLEVLETNETAKELYSAMGYDPFLREMVKPIRKISEI